MTNYCRLLRWCFAFRLEKILCAYLRPHIIHSLIFLKLMKLYVVSCLFLWKIKKKKILNRISFILCIRFEANWTLVHRWHINCKFSRLIIDNSNKTNNLYIPKILPLRKISFQGHKFIIFSRFQCNTVTLVHSQSQRFEERLNMTSIYKYCVIPYYNNFNDCRLLFYR